MAAPSISGESRISASAADDDVEAALGKRIPAGNRPVEQVEEGYFADIGIGARREPQPAAERGEADIGRQDEELAQDCGQPLFRTGRKRDQEQIDPRHAGEGDEFGDRAELGMPRDLVGRARIGAIIENAADPDPRRRVALERLDQLCRIRAAADDHSATLEPAAAGPAGDQPREEGAGDKEIDDADDGVGDQPLPRAGRIDAEEKPTAAASSMVSAQPRRRRASAATGSRSAARS